MSQPKSMSTNRHPSKVIIALTRARMHTAFEEGLAMLRDSGYVSVYPQMFITTFLAWHHACHRSAPVKTIEAKTAWGFLYLFAQRDYGFGDNLENLDDIVATNNVYTATNYATDAASLLVVALEANVDILARRIEVVISGMLANSTTQHKTHQALASVMAHPSFWVNLHTYAELVDGVRNALNNCAQLAKKSHNAD